MKETRNSEQETSKPKVLVSRGPKKPGRTRPELGLGTTSIGPLELEILDVMWKLGCPADVPHIFVKVLEKRMAVGELISQATVTTVLNRMALKNLVKRDRQFGTSIYTPILSRRETALRLIRDVIDKVLEGDASEIRDELRGL